MPILILVLSAALTLVPAAFADNGLVTVKSRYAVSETLDRFERAARDKGMTVFARIDHAEGAGKVNKVLLPTQLLIFGNPKVGTLLMQRNQAAGIDLPLKVLAWQDADGSVWLAYNDPAWLVERHGISGSDQVVAKMRTALQGFCATASGNSDSCKR